MSAAAAELELLYLAGGGAGQVRDELDVTRRLVAGQKRAYVLDQVLCGHSGVPRDDERLRTLAPRLVGHADHRDVLHRRVREQGLFDLDGGDVLAARDDDVLGPVD